MKKTTPLIIALAAIVLFSSTAGAVRLKDITSFKGIRTNPLIGYGMIVGLNGTGDKSGGVVTQSMANMMERMGVNVDKSQLQMKNVAAVMVTATMPAFARGGTGLDVTVSSLGDASSLFGGTLLVTPMKGVDGKVYALAQGQLALGGYGAGGDGGGSAKNHLQVAKIPNGATIEREIPVRLNGKEALTLTLSNPDFTTAKRVTEAINEELGLQLARAVDSGTVQIGIPPDDRGDVTMFIASLEAIDVTPDAVAKIVVNEKTGTVVIGKNVKISTVAVTHGNLTINVLEMPQVSQPNALAEGETVVTPQTEVIVEEEEVNVMLFAETTTIGDLIKALNAIGVTPRDMISIFQSIKAAGALQAELEIL